MIAPRIPASAEPAPPFEVGRVRRSARGFAAVAGMTFRGFFRDRSLPAALAALAAALLAGALLSGATLDGEGRLVRHAGAAAAGLLGWALALAHGSGLAGRGGALDRAALAAPVPSPVLLGGRFLGLAAGLLAWAALASALLGFGAALSGGAPEGGVAGLVGFGWFLGLRLLVVLALALLFSTLVPPAAAAILAGAAALAGFLPTSLPAAPFGETSAGPLAYRLLRLLLPDLSRLDPAVPGEGLFPLDLPFGLPFGLPLDLHALLYAVLYAGAALAGALALFAGRRGAGRG